MISLIVRSYGFYRKNFIFVTRVRQPDDGCTRSKSMKIHFLAKEVKGPAACIPLRTFKTGFCVSRGGRVEEPIGFQLEQRQNAPVCVMVWSCAFLFSMGMERTRSKLLRTSNIRNGTIHSIRLTRRLLIVASTMYYILHRFSTNTISISCCIKHFTLWRIVVFLGANIFNIFWMIFLYSRKDGDNSFFFSFGIITLYKHLSLCLYTFLHRFIYIADSIMQRGQYWSRVVK